MDIKKLLYFHFFISHISHACLKNSETFSRTFGSHKSQIRMVHNIFVMCIPRRINTQDGWQPVNLARKARHFFFHISDPIYFLYLVISNTVLV